MLIFAFIMSTFLVKESHEHCVRIEQNISILRSENTYCTKTEWFYFGTHELSKNDQRKFKL